MKVEEQLIQHCTQANITIGVAESCTGGYISSLITQVSGSSKCYQGGMITYATSMKIHFLGVEPQLIENHGMVSEAVAMAMAKGCIKALNVDFAIATTGIAGPEGGSKEIPCGTVCIAVAGTAESIVRTHQFQGDRITIIEAASHQAIAQLYDMLSKET